MADAVPVMAAFLLLMPNMLLLARIVASFALSCECPDAYVNAPRPTNVALPSESVFSLKAYAQGRTDDATWRAVVELRLVLLERLFKSWCSKFRHAVCWSAAQG